MKIIFEKTNKKILLITFFLSSLVIAGVLHTLDIPVNHTFGITLQSEATYHIKQAVNNQTLQWKAGDTVVLTQGSKASAWFYQANGHFVGVSVPKDSTGGEGGGGGGGDSFSSGSSYDYYDFSGVPIYINGECVSSCSNLTPVVHIKRTS